MGEIETDELLTRFIVYNRHFSSDRVKYAAFLPYPHVRLSVFRIGNLGEHEAWELGDKYVAPRRGPVLARADLVAEGVYSESLAIKATSSPPHHADIEGWPPEKEKQIRIAKKLAQRSELKLKQQDQLT